MPVSTACSPLRAAMLERVGAEYCFDQRSRQSGSNRRVDFDSPAAMFKTAKLGIARQTAAASARSGVHFSAGNC
jgi:uncharacterized ferredoxin-like protein